MPSDRRPPGVAHELRPSPSSTFGPPARPAACPRSAPVLMALLVTAGSMIPGARPASPLVPKIPVTFAGYPCSSHAGEWPTFTGHLSNSSGTMLSESTSGDVYGRISNADRTWEPTPGCGYYRYDAVSGPTETTPPAGRRAPVGDGQACVSLNTADSSARSGDCGTSGKSLERLRRHVPRDATSTTAAPLALPFRLHHW